MKGKHSLFGAGKPFRAKEFPYTDSKNKYDNYLLNKEHPVGKSKAEFIEKNFGYTKGDSEMLHKAISESIDGRIPDYVEKTKYGEKHSFNSKIRGKDGKMHSANIVVVVQKDNIEKPWRLITIKPGKKDK